MIVSGFSSPEDAVEASDAADAEDTSDTAELPDAEVLPDEELSEFPPAPHAARETAITADNASVIIFFFII